FLAAVLTLGLVVVAATSASADVWDDRRAAAEARAKAAASAAERIEHELEGTKTAIVQAAVELEGINAAITVATQQLQAAEAELARLQRALDIVTQRLTAAEALERQITEEIEADTQRAEEIRTAIGRLAREAYRGDVATSTLAAVLDAQSTEEFVQKSQLAETAMRTQTQALRELEQINAANRNRQVRQAAVREEIAELKAEA